MKSLPVKLLLLASSALLFIACSDDSTTSTTGSSDNTTSSSSSSSSSGGGGEGGAGSSSSSSGAGGTPAAGACTNADDSKIIDDPASMVKEKVSKCGKDNIAQEPATYDCIKMQTMLSDGCTQCYDDTVQCVAMKCFQPCFADANGQPCTDCRAMNCDGPFEMCSGLKVMP